MYVSSAAQPVNQPDALRLLLDRLGRGDDAALIAGGDGARVLLDLVADCLSGRRVRTLWAAEVLPSRPAASMPDDAALSRSFQALTVLDGACDRIVLLVGDAETVPPTALRYIQFASRTAPHLQLVFCGTRAFLDALNTEEFAGLRRRLTAGPILALAAPIIEDEDADVPPLPTVSDDPPAWAADAAPPSDAWGPAVSARKRSRALPLGALALFGLALLGLGGAAGFLLGMQGVTVNRPATNQQTASVQPPTLPEASAPGKLGAGIVASRADPEPVPAASGPRPSPPPVAVGSAQGTGSGSPPSEQPVPPPEPVPGPALTVRSQPKPGLPEDPRPPEPPTASARSLGRPNASAAPSRAAAMAALDSRIRRLREARDQAAPPPRDEEWAPSQPAFGSWAPPDSPPPPRYLGSYAADANGVRVFHPEP